MSRVIALDTEDVRFPTSRTLDGSDAMNPDPDYSAGYLREAVQHLAMLDFVAVSGTIDRPMIEYVDHLHEHFVTPVVVRHRRYRAPTAPGAGAEIRAESIAEHRYAGDG